MWDSHVHLQALGPAAELAAAWPEDYRAVSSACVPEEWEALAQLAEACPDRVIPAFGLHPERAQEWNDSHRHSIHHYLQRFPRAWCGETGLDKRYPPEAQKRGLRLQAEIALQMQRPLVLHCVGQYGATLEVLKQSGYTLQSPPVVLHRFGGSAQVAREFLRQTRCFFSLHASSLQKVSVQQALDSLPADRVLMETDGDARLGAGLTSTEKMRLLREQAQRIHAETARWPTAENLSRLCAWRSEPAAGF